MNKYKKVIFIVVIIIMVTLGLVLIINNVGSKKDKIKYENNDNIEIIVEDNTDGMQGYAGNTTDNNEENISGAAKVDEIMGGDANAHGQTITTEEMLKGKEIGI